MEVIKHNTKKPERPPWFADFYENDYKPFQQLVIKKFEEISTTLANVVKFNNLKTHE